MTEDRGAQVVHHALADLVREQGLDHAERAGHDRDRDHSAGVEGEGMSVVARDCLEHALEQERRHDAEARRDNDQE